MSASTCLIFCAPEVLLHTLATRKSNLVQGQYNFYFLFTEFIPKFVRSGKMVADSFMFSLKRTGTVLGLTHVMLDDFHLRSMYLELAMIEMRSALLRREKLTLILNLHPSHLRLKLHHEHNLTRIVIKSTPEIQLEAKFLEDSIGAPFIHCKMQDALLSEAEKREFVEKPKCGDERICTELDQGNVRSLLRTR